ncbi:neutral protease 2-like protein [Aspergillus campestris IBT 28561]|uniref:Neutral protease 2 n=1 Tax=Aspergillus campestris (strain IBT 28561) TaxID=1392248 RepID=A0A2I1D0A2_ASPC2|nr:neutral protease 2-like protein [Aspergillus campestris IBT 28561]PKY03305.1 neutral protease 2-like protein [Aspergillus campestris IBT 28561]
MRTSSAALLVLLPSVFAIPLGEAPSLRLDVTLSRVEDTRIKAVVKNVGSEDVTFVHINFFKDTAPVKKVALFQHDDSEIAFEGVEKLFKSSGLTEDVLTSLAPGDVYEDEFDVASTSNLSKGGHVTLHAVGRVPVVENSTITGSMPFKSNKLVIDVDGPKASKVAAAMKTMHKRTTVESCPSNDKQSALTTALQNAAYIASQAADAAESGPDVRFQEYFGTTDSETRGIVAARLRAAAAEASSTTFGQTSYYCYDVDEWCSPNVLAWTTQTTNTIANCDLYYTDIPPLTSVCHDQDQATTTLHELTHAPGVYNPGTEDFGYGYDAVAALSPDNALNNADTYSLFANAVYLNC